MSFVVVGMASAMNTDPAVVSRACDPVATLWGASPEAF